MTTIRELVEADAEAAEAGRQGGEAVMVGVECIAAVE